MKFGYGLLVVCVVAVAGIAILLFGVDLARPFRSTNAVVQPEPPPEASLPANAKPAAKPTRSRVRATPTVVEPAPGEEGSTVERTAADGKISAGSPKTSSAYGDAALSIRRVDRGHDLETLVYSRDRGREVAVVSLKDGKVSSRSSSSIIPADPPAPRPVEHATALLPRPAEPAPAAALATAVAKKSDKPLAEAATATNPPARPPDQARVATTVGTNVGTCGEYRDGKLTVKPCSQVPLSTSEWLAKGSSSAPAESAPAEAGH